MGLAKSDRPKGSFFLKNKPKANGSCVVYLRYFINGQYAKKCTNIEVSKKEWDQKKQVVRSSSDPYQKARANRINSTLKKFKDKYDSQIEQHDGLYTYDIVMQILHDKFKSTSQLIKETDFIEFALEHNNKRLTQNQIAYSTWNNARLSIQKFKIFIYETFECQKLYLNSITPKLFEDYKTWRIEKCHNCNETINKSLTPLFKAVNELSINGLVETNIANNIINKYLDIKQRTYDPVAPKDTVRYLSLEQMQNFIKLYDKVKYDRTREYIEIFLFSFYACGLRISDILTLEWNHINFEEATLTKNQYKTKYKLTIPLNQQAIDILIKWKDRNRNKKFVFDLLSEDFDLSDIRTLERYRLSRNKAIQTSLRELGKKIGLKFNLTIHVARHTFAVHAIKKHVDIYKLSNYLGHQSISSTEKTYAEFLIEDKKTILNDMLNFDLPSIYEQNQ